MSGPRGHGRPDHVEALLSLVRARIGDGDREGDGVARVAMIGARVLGYLEDRLHDVERLGADRDEPVVWPVHLRTALF